MDVTNTGSRAGDEVVQLYAHDAAAGVPRPLKQLRGFRRVHLEPGQKETLTFAVAARDLAFWDVTTHGWRVADGLFELAVGSSSLDVRARSSLRVQSQGSVDSGRP